MVKGNNKGAATAPVVVAAVAPAAVVVTPVAPATVLVAKAGKINLQAMYTPGKPATRLSSTTKHGTGGTAGTYAAVMAAAAANGGWPLQGSAIQAACTANGDPGFAWYGVRNLWWVLQPATK